MDSSRWTKFDRFKLRYNNIFLFMLGPPATYGSTIRNELIEKVGQIDIKGAIDVNENENDLKSYSNKKGRSLTNLLDSDVFEKLEKRFSNEKIISKEEFIKSLLEYVSDLSLVEEVYKKVDINNSGKVVWEDFTTFLITNGGRNSSLSTNFPYELVFVNEQINDRSFIHHDSVESICYSNRPSPLIITADRRGEIKVWDAQEISHCISSFTHRDKNSLFVENIRSRTNSRQRASIISSTTKRDPSIKYARITSLGVLPQSGHLFVGSLDGAVTIYDITKHDVSGRFSKFHDVPTCMEVFTDQDHILEVINQYLAVGDAIGNVYIIELQSTPKVHNNNNNNNNNKVNNKVNNSSRPNKQEFISIQDSNKSYGGSDGKNGHSSHRSTSTSTNSIYRIKDREPPTQNKFNTLKMAFDSYTKEKNTEIFERAFQSMHVTSQVHSLCVSQMQFIPYVHELVTCSDDGTIKFLSVSKKTVNRSFDNHKKGFTDDLKLRASHCSPRRSVLCFNWYQRGKFMCSAGTDRRILIWDVFTLETINILLGHASAIISLHSCDESQELFAITVNKDIYIWNLYNFELRNIITSSTHQMPVDVITSSFYLPSTQQLFLMGNRLSVYKVQLKIQNSKVEDGYDDIHSLLYSHSLYQILCISITGNIHVYDMYTGRSIFQFSITSSSTYVTSEAANDMSSSFKRNMIQNQPLRDAVTGLLTPFISKTKLDFSGKRLILSTLKNEIQIWNYNTGVLLKLINPKLPLGVLQGLAAIPFQITALLHEIPKLSDRVSDDDGDEILDEKGPEDMFMNLDKYSQQVRRDMEAVKSLLRTNSAEFSSTRFLLFGTNLGYGCCLEETVENISEEPIYCTLRKGDTDPFTSAVLWIGHLSENLLLVGHEDGVMSLHDLENGRQIREIRVKRDILGLVYSGSALTDNSNRDITKTILKNLNFASEEKTGVRAEDTIDEERGFSDDDGDEESQLYNIDSKSHNINPGRSFYSRRSSPSKGRPKTATAFGSKPGGGSVYSQASKSSEYVEAALHINPPSIANSSKRPTPRRPSTAHAIPKSSPSVISRTSTAWGRTKAQGIQLSRVLHTARSQQDTSRFSALGLKPEEHEIMAEKNIVVEHMLILRELRVIIGACSDKMIRFWEITAHEDKLLCVSSFDSKYFTDRKAYMEETLTCLALGRTDLAVGGFDDGHICIWLVHTRTLLNLRGALGHIDKTMKETFTSNTTKARKIKKQLDLEPISVPPLQLLKSWKAHTSTISSIHFLMLPIHQSSTDEKSSNDDDLPMDPSDSLLEGQRGQLYEGVHWILTESRDQRVGVWSLRGNLVGILGQESWDIGEKNTWIVHTNDLLEENHQNSSKNRHISLMDSPSRNSKLYISRFNRHVSTHSRPLSPDANKPLPVVVEKKTEEILVAEKSTLDYASYTDGQRRLDDINEYVTSLRYRPMGSSVCVNQSARMDKIIQKYPVRNTARIEISTMKMIAASHKAVRQDLIIASTRRRRKLSRIFLDRIQELLDKNDPDNKDLLTTSSL